ILGSTNGSPTLNLGGQTLTVNGTATVGSNGVLRLGSQSRLTGQGGVRLDGIAFAQGGTLEGTGLLSVGPSGLIDFATGASFGTFANLQRPLENLGRVRVGSNVTVSVGSVGITNRAGARWTFDGGNLRWGAGSPRFVNDGEIVKPGSTTNGIYFVALDQRGTLRVEGGELSLDSVAVRFAEGSTNGGAGALRLSGTSGDIASRLDFAGGIALVGATVTNTVTQSWGRLDQSNGTLAGPGDVTISNVWNLSGATLLGSGTLRLADSAIARWSGSALLGRRIDSRGTVTIHTNTLLYLDTNDFSNEGRIEVPDAASFRWFSRYGEGSLENRGTIVKSGRGSLAFSGVGLHNAGHVAVNGGSLDLGYDGANLGRVDLATGTRVVVGAALVHGPDSWIGGEGSVEFGSGTNDVRGTIQPRGGLVVSGGTVTVRNAFDRPVGLTLSGGSLALTTSQELRSLSVRGGELLSAALVATLERLDWNGGTLGGSGPVVLRTNALGRFRNGVLSTTLANEGTLELESSGSLRFVGGTLVNSGETRLIGSATLNAQFGTTNLLRNEGILRTGTNDVAFTGLPLDLRGTVEWTPVTIRLGPGTNRTRLDIPAGGRLSFQDSFVHSPESRLGGEGGLDFATGRHEVSGVFDPRGDFTLSSGELHVATPFTNSARAILRGRFASFGAPATLRDLVLEGTTVRVLDRLSILRSWAWNSGRLEGTGVVRTEPTAELLVSSFSDKALGLVFEAGGDVRWADGSRLYMPGGTWRIPASTTNRVLGSLQLWQQGNGPLGRVEIFGTLRKTGAGTLDVDASWEQSGTLLLDEGTIDLGATTRFAGATRLAPGAELRLAGTTNVWASGARFEGTGTLRTTAQRSVLRLEAPADLGSIASTFENGTRIQGEFPMRSGAGGSLNFRNGAFEVEGSLVVEGLLTVATATTLRVDDELRLLAGATLDNRGARDGQNRSNVRVRALVSQGATLLGVPPDIVPFANPLGVRLAPEPGAGSTLRRAAGR
ncbi:MAG: hypothetical protein JNL97_01710, partial [Verrucomicrobiales bacterium]|nr:hypothetical protein [Verrucomicrobiales bacterium]